MISHYKTKILPGNDPSALGKAVQLLESGHLVAFPTDTVYGLGANAFNSNAIDRLYAAKGRDASKAIAILVGTPEDLQRLTSEINWLAQRLAQEFWPGALTIIVPGRSDLPKNISQTATVGVRMPNHPITLNLLQKTGPLATTSANLSGGTSPKTAQEVFLQLQDHVPLILDGGKTPGGEPSTVVDCTGRTPIILRDGPISLEQILAITS